MAMLRFAANISWLFQELPFLERFAAARAAGFAAVEMRSPYEHPPEEVARRLRDNGLACVLFNLPMGERERGDFGLACRPFREGEFRDGVARAIEYAGILGAPRVNCIAGTMAPDEDRELLHEVLVQNLRFAAAALGGAGVELTMEPVNSIDVPGYFLPRNADVVRVIDEVGAPGLGLQFDLYHTAMMGDDLARTFEALLPRIRHIQFADAPGRGEPGTGQSPIALVLGRIAASEYAGWVSAEYRPTCETLRTLAWLRTTY
jgi:hydroxypyruvate isomerase